MILSVFFGDNSTWITGLRCRTMLNALGEIKTGLKKVQYIIQENSFQPYVVNKKVEGVEFKFLLGDLDGQEWYGGPDSQEDAPNLEMRFVREKMLQPQEVLLECGAHHGFTTILLAKWLNSSSQLISFEPSPKNFSVLKENCQINQLNNVVLEQKAVGSQVGIVQMFRKSNSAVVPQNNLSFGRLKNALYGVQEVEVIDLDGYVQSRGLKPTFLKIDVEGYEAEVLKGAKEILKTTPKIALEIHTEVLGRHNTSVKELLELIDISRYNCWIQTEDTEMPVPFEPQQAIAQRVHLFAIPKKSRP